MKKLSILIAATSLLTQPVMADDIEIFTGGGSAGSENILLIMDTSRSMSEWANDTETPPYDNSEVYDGYGFEPNSVYLFNIDSIGDIEHLTTDEVQAIKEHEVDINDLNCTYKNAINSDLENQGLSINTYAFFENNVGWEGSTVGTNNASIVQCRESYRYEFNSQSYRYLVNTEGYNDFDFPYTNEQRKQGRCLFGFFGICLTWEYIDLSYDWDRDTYDVLWKGNYLNYKGSDAGSTTPVMRIDIVKQAAKDVVGAMSSPNKSVALMRFNSTYYSGGSERFGKGGYVDIPMTPVTELGDNFNNEIDSYDAFGGTPIEQSLYEAYRYLSGNGVVYGRNGHRGVWDKPIDDAWRDNSTSGNGIIQAYNNFTIFNESSSEESRTGWVYNAPEFGGCKPSTKIVLFSDGAPSLQDDASEYIEPLIRTAPLDSASYISRDCETSDGIGGECAEEMANYLKNVDHRPLDVAGSQLVTIDTIGGFLTGSTVAEEKLRNIAEAGGGNLYLADNYDALVESFTKAINGNPLEEPATFTSPAIAVSSFNSLELSDELYYAVFEPAIEGGWKGNLKKYKVTSEGVVGADGRSAVDSASGYFKDTAQSFWSTAPDGADVTKGGAASLFTSSRNILGVLNGSVETLTEARVLTLSDETLGLDLLQVDDLLDSPETGLTGRQRLAKWIVGKNDDDTPRQEMEDPIHSRPLVLNYASGPVVFVGTNSGYLHAFNTETGAELFSLIPHELLNNPLFYLDSENFAYAEKTYGFDGPITYWHKDTNLNGLIESGEKVYLYVGMRRGGHSYYAFDVSNPTSPSLAWQKNGPYSDSITKNAPSVSSGFDRLGQTWSSLRPAMIRWGTEENKVVLIASGGYDPDEDGTSSEGTEKRFPHDVGNTIYILDPETGAILWDAYSDLSALNGDMTSSFVANPVLVDTDTDGNVDRIYAADVGGRVWRFDLRGNSPADIYGGVILDINTSEVEGRSGNRRFFYSPDVTKLKDTVYISIGSGYRAHPLETAVDDRFFVIKDSTQFDSNTGKPVYPEVNLSDLKEWTSANLAVNVPGWFVNFTATGEKAFARSLTLDGIVRFSTFAVNSNDAISECTGNLGKSINYKLCLPGATSCGGESVFERTEGPSRPPTPPTIVPGGGGGGG
ncbi:pilus assembly protein, partial [Thalassolituus sp. UBA675]